MPKTSLYGKIDRPAWLIMFLMLSPAQPPPQSSKDNGKQTLDSMGEQDLQSEAASEDAENCVVQTSAETHQLETGHSESPLNGNLKCTRLADPDIGTRLRKNRVLPGSPCLALASSMSAFASPTLVFPSL